jgi:hypothetical protein
VIVSRYRKTWSLGSPVSEIKPKAGRGFTLPAFFQMMTAEIHINKDYILVAPKEGINYREIRRAIARLFYVSGMPQKNGIWVFREGEEKFTPDDLYRLKDIIKENFPKDVKINKIAVVAKSGFQLKMAESFRQIGDDLPFEIRVFSEFKEAEAWVKT